MSNSIDRLLTKLRKGDKDARLQAAHSLGERGDLRAVLPLIASLNDREEAVCDTAEAALVEIGEPAVNRLCTALQEHQGQRRDRIAEALGRIGSQRAVEPLAVALQDDDIVGPRYALEALLAIGPPAVEALIARLKDGHLKVRLHAVYALGQIGDDRATIPLCNASRDGTGWIRSEAVRALGMIGDIRAVGPLCAALKDPDDTVRQDAAEALERIKRRVHQGDARMLPVQIVCETRLTLAQRISALDAFRTARYKNQEITLIHSLPDVQSYCNYLLRRADLGATVCHEASAILEELRDRVHRQTLLRASEPESDQTGAELLRGVSGEEVELLAEEHLRAAEPPQNEPKQLQNQGFWERLFRRH